jgi:maltooligosyltrehalose trehalohydrolase
LPTLGALALDDGRCRFRVWAPHARSVDVHIVAPQERVVALEPEASAFPEVSTRIEHHGYFSAVLNDVSPGARYLYRQSSPAGSVERPDPASRFQPDGVHGPSEVADPAFPWSDGHWRGLPLSQYILYELHVGTFSPEGTFDGILPHLDALADLGITAVELMPVAQFPGGRKWGYAGVYPFAFQNT